MINVIYHLEETRRHLHEKYRRGNITEILQFFSAYSASVITDKGKSNGWNFFLYSEEIHLIHIQIALSPGTLQNFAVVVFFSAAFLFVFVLTP